MAEVETIRDRMIEISQSVPRGKVSIYLMLYKAFFPIFKLWLGRYLSKVGGSYTQCPEIILNKIEKTFNKTYTGLKSFLQRFQICFSQNPSCRGMEFTG